MEHLHKEAPPEVKESVAEHGKCKGHVPSKGGVFWAHAGKLVHVLVILSTMAERLIHELKV